MSTPYKLDVVQKDNELIVKSTSVVEWADDEVTKQIFPLNGEDVESIFFGNVPRIQNANWSVNKDSLVIDSKVVFNFRSRKNEIKSRNI